MQRRWTRRQALAWALLSAPLLAGCTVSGSVQQKQNEQLANATPSPTANPAANATATAAAAKIAQSVTPQPTIAPTFTPGGQTTLAFGAAGSAAELDAYSTISAAYAQATPNTKVDFTTLPGDGVAALDQALAAGNAPDVITVPWDQLAVWADKGRLDDLTALAGAGRLDLSGSYPMLKDFGTVGGKTLAAPLAVNPRVLYYNVDLFTKAGISAPGDTFDWQAFEAAATKLASGGHAGFATAAAPFDWFAWVWAAGGSVFDDDLNPTKTTLTDTASVSGLQRFADLWRKQHGAVQPGTGASTNPTQRFAAGTVGMATGDRATLADLAAAKFRYQVTYLPQGPGGHATTYSATFGAVSSSSRQALVASGLLNFLAVNKDAQTQLAKTGVVVPALTAAAESKDFASGHAAIDDVVFTRTLLFAYQPPRTAAWSAVQAAWNPELGKLWAGSASAADAAKALQPKVDAALKAVAATPTASPVAVQPPAPTSTPAPAASPKASPAATPAPGGSATPTP